MPHADLAGLAARIRAAYAAHDLAAFGVLLDEHVRWGPAEETPETCHSRAQVMTRLQARAARGVQAHVEEATAGQDAILLKLQVRDSSGRERPVWQVLRVRDGLIVDIRGYPTRAAAAAASGVPDTSPSPPRSVVPILNVSDLAASFAWFERLGWARKWDWQGTFGAVGSEEAEVFLCQNGQGQPGTWLSVWVDDVEAVHGLCLAAGVEVLQPPRDEAWGVREMHVRHPDGHILRISQSIPHEH